MNISIIIATYNEEKNIARLLKSIKKQTYKNFEVIVVDNYSKDKTKEIAKKFTKKVYSFGKERSAQRNFGLKKTKGNYVLFLDADMELEPSILKESLKLASSNSKLCAITIDEVARGQNFLAKIKNLEKQLYTGEKIIEAPRFFRRKDLAKIGGYDENLIAGEDWDLAQRIKKLGSIGKIKAKIYHHDTGSLLSDVKKKYYYAKNIQKYAQKHPQTFQEQASLGLRLKILFQRPSLIFKNPHNLAGLLLLKSLHYMAYLLAKSQLIERLEFAQKQIKAILENVKTNIKLLAWNLRKNGLIYVLTRSLPQLFTFIFGHFKSKYLSKNKTFILNGQKYSYFYNLYNFTYFGERCVEVPIIWREVQKNQHLQILEVGNVLSHYFPVTHEIVDKYEKAPDVINSDITKYSPQKRYDLIVSVSTLEHVGWDERTKNSQKIILAIQKIKNLLKIGGRAIVTLPMGYNPHLDKILMARNGKLFNKNYFLKRISRGNYWKQVKFKNVQNTKFNSPYPFANAILVGIIKK